MDTLSENWEHGVLGTVLGDTWGVWYLMFFFQLYMVKIFKQKGKFKD